MRRRRSGRRKVRYTDSVPELRLLKGLGLDSPRPS